MSEDYGKFSDDPIMKLLPDGRKVEIVKDFWYLDPTGTKWLAPAGSIVDGASIPQVLWSFAGGPLEGMYRNASIVHDVACVQKTAPWQHVHLMFYDACRCGGVGELKAKIMFGVVWKFGPRWSWPAKGVFPMAPISEAKMNEDFEALKQFVEIENPSLERIGQFAEQ